MSSHWTHRYDAEVEAYTATWGPMSSVQSLREDKTRRAKEGIDYSESSKVSSTRGQLFRATDAIVAAVQHHSAAGAHWGQIMQRVLSKHRSAGGASQSSALFEAPFKILGAALASCLRSGRLRRSALSDCTAADLGALKRVFSTAMAGDQNFRRQHARTEAVLRTLVLRAMQPAGIFNPSTTNAADTPGVSNADVAATNLFPELSTAPNSEKRVSIWWPAENEFFEGTVLDSIPACYVRAGRTLSRDAAPEEAPPEVGMINDDEAAWHLVLYDDGDAEWVRLDQERQRTISDSESAVRHMEAIGSLHQLLETRKLQQADKAEIETLLEGLRQVVRSGKYDVQSGGGGDSAFVTDATAALQMALADSGGSDVKAASTTRAFEEYAVGAKVQTNWKVGRNEKWFPGSITEARNVDGCRLVSVFFETDNHTATYSLPQDIADLRLDTEIGNSRVHAVNCLIKMLGQIQTKWSEIETLPEKSEITHKRADELPTHASSASLVGCMVCHQLKDAAKVLLCDGCDGEVHMYSASPFSAGRRLLLCGLQSWNIWRRESREHVFTAHIDGGATVAYRLKGIRAGAWDSVCP